MLKSETKEILYKNKHLYIECKHYKQQAYNINPANELLFINFGLI